MKAFIFSSLFLLVSSTLMAQQNQVISPQPYTHEKFPESTASSKNMKVLNIPFDSSQVTYYHNVKFAERNGLDLSLQVIVPKTVKGNLPCIVYVQGSAWMKQNVYANLPQLAEFARRGYVIAIVEYRPSSVAKFPAQLQDAKTAIRFMRQNAQRYHVDPDNLIIWGDSSGGHTALMVGLTQDHAELDTDELKGYPIEVNAVIDFFGPTDITQMNLQPSTLDHISPKSPEGQLLGGKNVLENKVEAALTNPITYIKPAKKAAPILIMHGSKDRTVPFQQSVLLADALEKQGYAYQFYQLKGADHGSSEFWTRQAFDIVDEFIKTNLKK